MEKFIPYAKQYIDHDDINAVINVLHSDYLTTGPCTKQFEEKFASYVGAKYAVAVSSGTAALHLACIAADVQKNGEVITTPMTFAASANCALYAGAKPVFADIDPHTYTLDPHEIEKKITDRTTAIIPVHYTGLPCFMEKIKNIAQKYDLSIIEDACHALGARYKGSRIGDCRYSDMTAFSFHPVKHITTGEGGMITTNSIHLYNRLLALRNHGITRDDHIFQGMEHGGWYYEMQALGYNYRITEIQAALGISQINKLDKFLKIRRQIAEQYTEAFIQLPLELPYEPLDCINAYHLYVIRLKKEAKINRRELYDQLKKRGIYCQVHYIPIHSFDYYKQKFDYKWGDFPQAEDHYNRVLSIPLFYAMTHEEVERVIRNIKELLK